jgi:hypothetical protein
VRFTEYDHVVQALPADRANESLDICILPGGDELKLQEARLRTRNESRETKAERIVSMPTTVWR